MEKHRALTLTFALGLTLIAGPAAAEHGNQYAGQEIGKIRYINRTQNLVALEDGRWFYTTDQRMLDGLREGEVVKVDFWTNGERAYLNSIAPSTPEDYPGAGIGTGVGGSQH
jgi:hypothetical protein